MKRKTINFSDALNYLPGFIILVFSMMALQSSMLLIKENKEVFSGYAKYSQGVLELEDKFHEFSSYFNVYSKEPSPENRKELLEGYAEFHEVHQKVLMEAQHKNTGYSPENYTNTLLKIQEELSSIMDVVSHQDQVISNESIALIGRELHEIHENLEDIVKNYNPDQEAGVVQALRQREMWLYWSVLAIGFCGFLLVVLNSDKLRKLKKINQEKKEALAIMSSRLAAMEASRDGIAIVSKDGNLSYMNNALMRIHKIPEDEAYNYIGHPWEKLYTQKGIEEILEGRKKVQENAKKTLREKGYWLGESPIDVKDGEIVNVELSLTSLPDGGFIGTVRDISDRKKIEDERKNLENQFYQAQKMEAIGRLAGGIAHDFNNILAAMNGYAEFLIDDLEEKSPQHQFAVNILQAGRQARDLVDQMLAFSRRKESSKDTLDLTAPIHETLSMLKATLPKTIEVQSNIKVSSAPIKGNSNQIAQVIMNLCVNARDAIESDHGELKVGLEIASSSQFNDPDFLIGDIGGYKETPPIKFDEPSPGRTRLFLGQMIKDTDYVRLSVEDTGCGMSKIIMERIFEPFFTTKPVDKGTGLGLSTVHGVVAGHKAAMIVDSMLGKGTRFELLFPLAESAARVQSGDEAEADFVGDGKSGRILVVEDQNEVRDMLLTMLERLGYEAAACHTGLEALDVLRENPGAFDLVLTDHNMPKMTGLELAQQVSYDFPDLPFILLSGYSEQRMQELMAENPVIKAVLRKPIAKNQLAQKIQSVISTKKMAA